MRTPVAATALDHASLSLLLPLSFCLSRALTPAARTHTPPRSVAANGIAVSEYKSEEDPGQKDSQLTRLVPFLQFLAIGRRLGTVENFSAELQQLGVSTEVGGDNGEGFEKAVHARFAELRKEGKMPVLQRGGRATLGGAQGPTLWNRMGLGSRRE